MNLRREWRESEEQISDRFYTVEETVSNVVENFDLRRYRSTEGYDIEINGVMERCLVQTSSNPLRELNDYRKIHCPMTADVKRGYYVKYENETWIIDTNVVNVDGAYWTTRMSRCQYVLRWQNSSGEIIERWAYASDQTKYSNGETGNATIMIADNQYGLLLPIDSETKLLKRGMRFAFDFDDAEVPDIYDLSNRKINLAEGTIQLSFSFDAFNKDKDKRVTMPNGLDVWICDYHSPTAPTPPPETDETAVLSASISGSSQLKLGSSRIYVVTFTDKNGAEVTNTDFIWNIVSDFEVDKIENGNTVKLCVEDDSLIGESFLLQVVINEQVMAEIELSISGVF